MQTGSFLSVGKLLISGKYRQIDRGVPIERIRASTAMGASSAFSKA
jgi:hypothetical protein